MASKELVALAMHAALASSEAGRANRAWRAAFAKEYGHDDIGDVLVGVIDYSFGDVSMLTASYIDAHSKSGNS